MRLRPLFCLGIFGLLIPTALLAQTKLPAGGTLVGPDPLSVCDGISGNLVQNCGFETGTFAHWTQSGYTATYTSVSGTLVNSGDYSAQIGPYTSYTVPGEGLSNISQSIGTGLGSRWNLPRQLDTLQ
jgi:hypothetical protein